MRVTSLKSAQHNVEFLDERLRSHDGPYFSVLIGKNGSGKSTILAELASCIKQPHRKRSDSLSIEFDRGILPTRVIAFSNTIADKFPLMSRTVNAKTSIVDSNIDVDYFYFGPRARGFVSSRNPLRQMLDAIRLASMEERTSANLEHIFETVGYRPQMELKYIRQRKDKQNAIGAEDFKSEKKLRRKLETLSSERTVLQPFIRSLLSDQKIFQDVLEFAVRLDEDKGFQFTLDLRQLKEYESYLPRLKALHIGEKLGLFRLQECYFAKSDQTIPVQRIP